MPILHAPQKVCPPDRLTAFDRARTVTDDHERRRTWLHGFTDDKKLARLVREPAKRLTDFASFGGILTPDLSLHRDMPTYLRKVQVLASRRVGAYYQSRGLNVIVTVRWAEPSDLSFCLQGVPRESCVAVSTHGILRDQDNRFHFQDGLGAMLAELRPVLVIVHGPCPPALFDPFRSACVFVDYPADIRRGRDAARPTRVGLSESHARVIPGLSEGNSRVG